MLLKDYVKEQIIKLDDGDVQAFGSLTASIGRPCKGYMQVFVVGSYIDPLKSITLGRVLLNVESELEVDHVDRDPLNFNRDNLRICTHQQNCFNQGPRRNNTSGFKGVYWDKFNNKWRASIMVDGYTNNIGRYEDIVEAAKAYDAEARRFHKEFAYQNFPLELNP